MAGPESGVLAPAPGEQSGPRRTQPPTATSPGSEAEASQSCQQQLSFRSKAFRGTGLAGRRGPGASCQQQLSSSASLGSGSTSASSRPTDRILPTTTFWHRFAFRRIKGVAPCSRPNRSTTCIVCTGPSTGAGSHPAAAHEQTRSLQGHHCRMAGKGCLRNRRGDPTAATAVRLHRRSHNSARLPPKNPSQRQTNSRLCPH